MSASPAHAKAWRTRKERDRIGRVFMTEQLAAEIGGRQPRNKRRRFINPQPTLLLVAPPPPAAPPSLLREVFDGLGWPALIAALFFLLLWSIFGTDFWVNDGKDRSVTRILFPTQIARTAP